MYKFYNWRLLHPTADGGGGSDGAKGAGAEGADGANDGDGDGDPDEADDDDGDSDDSKEVTMTQSELDALINKAFKRGARKAAKENRAQTAPPPADDGQDDGKADKDAEARVAKIMADANAKLLAATVKSIGADMAISAKGLKVAERVIDMDDCVGANGEIDEEAVEEALEDFIKEYPEFKTGGGKKPGVKQFEGNPKGSGVKMSKEEIMKIKDPAKRRKAIADNISLFQ